MSVFVQENPPIYILLKIQIFFLLFFFYFSSISMWTKEQEHKLFPQKTAKYFHLIFFFLYFYLFYYLRRRIMCMEMSYVLVRLFSHSTDGFLRTKITHTHTRMNLNLKGAGVVFHSSFFYLSLKLFFLIHMELLF